MTIYITLFISYQLHLAHIEHGNAGVVVTDLTRLVLPSVDVQMLVLDALAELLADKHMVQSLAVAVKQIRVSLCRGDLGSFVSVHKAGSLDESLNGRNVGELVEVTGSDDVGLGVLLEDLRNEFLNIVS